MKFIWKKIIVTTMLATLASAALATDDVVKVLHTGGRTGSVTNIAMEYSDELKKTYAKVDVSGPGGCVPVLAAAARSSDPTLIIWHSIDVGNADCKKEFAKQSVVSVFVTHYLLCGRASDNPTLDNFTKNASRVGLLYDFPFWDKWFKDMAVHSKALHTYVPVGDSGKQVLSLMSGETDWVLVNSHRAKLQLADKKIKCVATTNPQGELGAPFLGNTFPKFDRADLGWHVSTYVIGGSRDQQLRVENIVKNLHKSQEFKNFLDQGNFVDYTYTTATERGKLIDRIVNQYSVK